MKKWKIKHKKAVKDILQVLAENEFTAFEATSILEITKGMLSFVPIKKDFIPSIECSDYFKSLS